MVQQGRLQNTQPSEDHDGPFQSEMDPVNGKRVLWDCDTSFER